MTDTWGLHVGWLDTSVDAVMRTSDSESPISSFVWVLVTSLDSTTDLASIPAALAATRQYPTSRLLKGGLVIPMRDLQSVTSRQDLFRGFDELWLFDSEPAETKPNDVTIVGPLDFRTNEPTPELTAWMGESGCRLGLGDGIGMNYVTPDGELAEQLARML
jgi:hypothetical protein